MRWYIQLLVALVVLDLSSAALAYPLNNIRRVKAQARLRPASVVQGMDGQADLQLDVGRSLQRYALRKRAGRFNSGSNRSRMSARSGLTSLEKVRLDARRIGLASELSTEQQLERFIAMVQHRMPVTREAVNRYDEVSRKQVNRWGVSRLSHFTRKRVGLCRESSFLLKAILDEVGIQADVQYGVLFDSAQNYIGGHAWVEALVSGRRLLLDPSMRKPIQVRKPITIEKAMPDGSMERVNGAQTSKLLYVPTNDMFIEQ